ncbi:hypothetical protein HPB48_009320 [Haemaphysalis longicornis]|uniref:SAP domain-containing protein n=1 Tax=Haemaphysalis longicornis TaxID=44386 RepID=A0A9J6G977_HAELO|nr:hypothetical protein HPB48_009320 [Haemaphysalis longicornis]
MPLERPSLYSQPSHLAEPLCGHGAMQVRQHSNIVVQHPVRHLVFLAGTFRAVRSLASLYTSACAGCWTRRQDCVVCVNACVEPARRNIMPGIVCERLDPVTMSRLGIDIIREELAQRHLYTAGSKEDLILTLEAYIQQQHESSPPVEANASASSGAASLTQDAPALQSCLAVPAATLPSNDGKDTARPVIFHPAV